MLADDVKLYLKIVNNVNLCTLQVAMNALCKWADLWQLSISVEKCCVLSIGKPDPIDNIFLNGTALPYVTSCRDLCVTVSSDLSFLARDSMLSALYAIANPSVCPSVRLSVCLSVRHTGGSVKNG